MSSKERLRDILIPGEELNNDGLVQEFLLIENVEANESTGDLLKLNESLTQSRLLYR
jgi:hypothetical protein